MRNSYALIGDDREMECLRICIFPNDPIISYYEKGEIKERYYNPENFFDEVHIISFIDDDVKEEKITTIVGNDCSV